MRTDPLKQYAKLRQQLLAEKAQLESRLHEINLVLQAEASLGPGTSSNRTGISSTVRRRGRGENRLSLRQAIVQALGSGPLSRQELAQAVKELGYVSHAKDPLNSMGVVLYAKNSPFKKKDGKFYLPSGIKVETTDKNGHPTVPAKRTMSPEAKAKIAAAQRARWARQKRASKPVR